MRKLKDRTKYSLHLMKQFVFLLYQKIFIFLQIYIFTVLLTVVLKNLTSHIIKSKVCIDNTMIRNSYHWMFLIYTIRTSCETFFFETRLWNTNLMLKLLKVYHIVLSHNIESYDIITENVPLKSIVSDGLNLFIIANRFSCIFFENVIFTFLKHAFQYCEKTYFYIFR